MFLKAPKLEHLDNVRNRCWDQNLAGIPEMGTSNVLGRTQSKMGYNAKMQSVREAACRLCTSDGADEQEKQQNGWLPEVGGRGGKPPGHDAPALPVYKPAAHGPASEKGANYCRYPALCVYVSSNNLRKGTVISLYVLIFYSANHLDPSWSNFQTQRMAVTSSSETTTGYWDTLWLDLNLGTHIWKHWLETVQWTEAMHLLIISIIIIVLKFLMRSGKWLEKNFFSILSCSQYNLQITDKAFCP